MGRLQLFIGRERVLPQPDRSGANLLAQPGMDADQHLLHLLPAQVLFDGLSAIVAEPLAQIGIAGQADELVAGSVRAGQNTDFNLAHGSGRQALAGGHSLALRHLGLYRPARVPALAAHRQGLSHLGFLPWLTPDLILPE